MHRFAMRFSVIFLLLSLFMLFSVIYFNMPLIMSGNRLAMFIILNAVMLVGVAIFFLMSKDRIILYFENYRREKQL